jgi:hypothetical protein
MHPSLEEKGPARNLAPGDPHSLLPRSAPMPQYRPSAAPTLAAFAGAGMTLVGLFGTLVSFFDERAGGGGGGPPFSIWKRLLFASPWAFLLACGVWLFIGALLAELAARKHHHDSASALGVNALRPRRPTRERNATTATHTVSPSIPPAKNVHKSLSRILALMPPFRPPAQSTPRFCSKNRPLPPCKVPSLRAYPRITPSYRRLSASPPPFLR